MDFFKSHGLKPFFIISSHLNIFLLQRQFIQCCYLKKKLLLLLLQLLFIILVIMTIMMNHSKDQIIIITDLIFIHKY